MTLWIEVDEIVIFSSNNGIIISKPDVALAYPDRLIEAVKIAARHRNDHYLAMACCGGAGPLAQYSYLKFEEYWALAESLEFELVKSQATAAAKRDAISARRQEFQSIRPILILQMIESGIPYYCAFDGCGVCTDLTVDHKFPLSRGGTDEISNLQFMCRAHNSQKGDRT